MCRFLDVYKHHQLMIQLKCNNGIFCVNFHNRLEFHKPNWSGQEFRTRMGPQSGELMKANVLSSCSLSHIVMRRVAPYPMLISLG